MTASSLMPVLFVGHGSPMNAIEDNEWSASWVALAEALPQPKAILCISAHWETRGAYVSATPTPETIHDFYGFPKALFDVHYNASGSPELAKRIAALISDPPIHLDPGRGLDHGSWSVLCRMYPEADIPVVQLSLDTRQPGGYHYQLGTQLQALREEGVLIIGSGNIVHNLGLFRFHDKEPYDWAERFRKQANQLIQAGDHLKLADYNSLGVDARHAIPTPEHYLPLLYVLALQRPGERVTLLNDVAFSSMSMTSVVVGL